MKCLSEYIKESQITEMASNLSNFRMLIINLKNQIIENWCLVHWCDLNPDNDISKRLRNHWVSELKSYMYRIVEVKLKSGRKDKVIQDELIKHYELDDHNEIADVIRDKFKEENLGKYVINISFDCADKALEICKVLSTNNKDDIEEYINGYLG